MTLFSGASAKIARARFLAFELDQEFQRFRDGQHYTVDQVPNHETGRKAGVFRVTRDFPHDWPVKIGELLHDLRSALDHAVYEMTVIEQGHPLERTEFPIFEDEAKYFSTIKRGRRKGEPAPDSGLFKIRGVPDAAKTVIASLQPFEHRKTRGANQYPVLSILHDLNIIDKHRTLNLCRRQTILHAGRVVRDINLPVTWNLNPILEDGAVLAEWAPIGMLDDEVDVEFNIGFEIAFGNTMPLLEGQPVLLSCERLIRGTERVLYYLRGGTDD